MIQIKVETDPEDKAAAAALVSRLQQHETVSVVLEDRVSDRLRFERLCIAVDVSRSAVQRMSAILAKNQNPDIGDGSFNEAQWTQANDVVKAAKALIQVLRRGGWELLRDE